MVSCMELVQLYFCPRYLRTECKILLDCYHTTNISKHPLMGTYMSTYYALFQWVATLTNKDFR
jgi:hypothetical protein